MKFPPALLALLFCCLGTCVRAQIIVDDFEDGDLLNRAWTGDTQDFVVSDGRLRLMADGAGTSVLELRLPEASIGVDSFALELLAEMDFKPSTSNFCTVDLIEASGVNTPTQSSVLTRLGGISGDDDAWTGSVFAEGDLLRGSFSGEVGALGLAPALVRMRIEYVRNDGWRFLADYTGGREFVAQGSIVDPGRYTTLLLRITCDYTSTRTDKFSFDDLSVRSVALADTEAPTLVAARVEGPRAVTLEFSEAVSAPLATDPGNYSFSTGQAVLATAIANGNLVALNFAQDLPNGEDVTLVIGETADGAGNSAQGLTATFRYEVLSEPRVGNVVINEFLPDPNPVVGLPEAEFIELYNPTDTTVSLAGLGVASGGSPVRLGDEARLPAGGYLVISRSDDAESFRSLGANTVGVALPTLSNSADEISIVYAGNTLQQINYTSAWYNDPERDDGGYSIEYTGGADAGCSASWKASEDGSGGTPGRVNSVLGRTVDTQAPTVVEVNTLPTGVELTFDEPIDPLELTADLFAFSPQLAFSLSYPAEDQVLISAPLAGGTIYTLTLQPDYSDCAGNFPTEALSLTVALPATPQPGDVVINEVLFNPATGGADFVELFNCSDKVFQVNGWRLENNQSTTSSGSRTIGVNRLFLPGDYLTFSPDPEDISARFLNVDPNLLIDQTLPTLPDDQGNLTVAAAGVVLDAFDYTEDYHSELLSPNDGVSLERLRQKSPTQDAGNWFSAASTENFGTPTRPNSQRRQDLAGGGQQVFSLISTTFSPDGDSYQDVLELAYVTDGPGYLARVSIFDAQGRPVRSLTRTELLASEGVILWDGANDEGRRARLGAYVLLIELVAPDGGTRTEKLVAVLAGER